MGQGQGAGTGREQQTPPCPGLPAASLFAAFILPQAPFKRATASKARKGVQVRECTVNAPDWNHPSRSTQTISASHGSLPILTALG